jgi:hypothetical protein
MSKIWSLQVTHLLGCVGIEVKKLSDTRARKESRRFQCLHGFNLYTRRSPPHPQPPRTGAGGF